MSVRSASQLRTEASGDKARMCIEIIRAMDKNNNGQLEREELRHLVKHLNPDFTHVAVDDICLDDPRITALVGQTNNVLARYIVDHYPEDYVHMLHNFLGLTKDNASLLRESLAAKSKPGQYKVIYSGGCRFRKSPTMQDVLAGNDFAAADSTHQVIRIIIGEDGRQYGQVMNSVMDSNSKTLDLYIPLRLDNGQEIIERVADLPQELITDLDRISVEMSTGNPLFGVPLAEAARLSDPDGLVPSVIRGGAMWLIEHGLDTADLFQDSGAKAKVSAITDWFDRNPQYQIPAEESVSTVGTMIQQFLIRMTYEDGTKGGKLWGSNATDAAAWAYKVSQARKATAGKSKIPLRPQAVRDLLDELPEPSMATLKMLAFLMSQILANKAANKMDSEKLMRILPEISWAFKVMMENFDEVFAGTDHMRVHARSCAQ